MKQFDFDDLAVKALRTNDEPSELVWAKCRPKKSWLPTWPEIGFAAAAGGITLLCLATIGNRTVPPAEPLIAQKPPVQRPAFEASFAAINRLAGVPEGLMSRLTARRE